ncbi:MAG TPA: hypothetical protein VF042_05525 [Gemmatimonadaceae bacterium]
MSVFEWIFEQNNRGPSGTVDFDSPAPHVARRPIIIMRSVIAVVILGGAVWMIAISGDPVAGGLLLAIYLVASYGLAAKPDMSNTGVAGIIDHPFRYSDDVNRYLVGMRLVLWPGRLVLGSLRDLIWLARGKRVIYLRRTSGK